MSLNGLILAIDPSLTGTAAFIGESAEAYSGFKFTSKNLGADVLARMSRCDFLVHEIMEWVSGRGEILAVFIEAYSYGSNDAHAKFAAEYGGILRWHLADLCERVYEVAPMTLKKFATGSGKGKKVLVAAHLTKRYGVMFDSDDEFDAYGLFRLGLVAMGREESPTKAQAEAVASVLGNPKRRTRKTAASD